MFSAPASSDPASGVLPRGEVLGTYSSHQQARQVVDRLAEQEFDVKTVSIVGTDLRMVERVRNRLTYASVALRSALQGAFFGVMLGLLLSLLDPSRAGVQILVTAAIGMAIWVIMGVIGFSIRKGRGGFDSVQQLVPTSFDVVCDFSSAAQARQLMGAPGAAHAPPQTPHSTTSTTTAAHPGAHGAGTGGPVPEGQPGPERVDTPGHPDQPDRPDQLGQPHQPGPTQDPAAPLSAGQPAPAAPPQDPAAPPSAGQPASPADAGNRHDPSSGGHRQEQGAAPVRSTSTYPDLPDGRPQYGVRLPEAEARALQERILREQGLHVGGDPGAGPSSGGRFQAPTYGRRSKAPQAPQAPQATPSEGQQSQPSQHGSHVAPDPRRPEEQDGHDGPDRQHNQHSQPAGTDAEASAQEDSEQPAQFARPDYVRPASDEVADESTEQRRPKGPGADEPR